MVNVQAWKDITAELQQSGTTLIAVSKTKPVADIEELYNLGQRDFGENYVQELEGKQSQLPADIHWHYIGHLQSNKVKYIAPYIHTIHAVDSIRLLQEINKQAAKNNRTINVLLQLHIADEETKHGLDEEGMLQLLNEYKAEKSTLSNIKICGLMGMATFTEDEDKIRSEFQQLHDVFKGIQLTYFVNDDDFKSISMGMSSDYKLAIEEGSTMVRVGSLLFGSR